MRNEPLRRAIQEINASSNSTSRSALYDHLLQGILLLVVEELPAEIEANGRVLQEDLPLSLLTVTMPGGGIAILAFTDSEALRAYSPNGPYVAMQSTDVLKTMIDQSYDALIINAAGPWAGVSRQEVLDILQQLDYEETE